MKIALAQTAVIRGEFEKNLDRAEATAKEAAAQSAELVVFPEMFVSGFDYKKNQIKGILRFMLIMNILKRISYY